MTDYADVIRAQRMIRPPYADRPVDRATITELVAESQKAPSAGFSQGASFLALDDPDTIREFYQLIMPPDTPIDQLLPTPVILLPMQSSRPYLERYSQPDKAQWGMGESEDAWPAPYWIVDTSFAAMVVLLSATARGLGGWFFGIPSNEAELMRRLGVPDDTHPIGAIALGWPREGTPAASGLKSRRRHVSDVLRWDRW